MRNRPWARVVAAVGGGAALALTAPMLAAIGQVSPPAPVLTIGPTARLVAQGAAVAVPVRVVVTCPQGGAANVNVQVVQSVGREVAHAFGNASDIVCDGTPQVTEVFATSSDFTFRPGVAFATANLFACSAGPFPGPFPGSSCTAEAHREIQIVSGVTPPPTLPPGPPPPGPGGPPPVVVPPPVFPPIPGLPGSGFIADLLRLIGFGFPFGTGA